MYTPRRSIRKAWLAMLGLALFASAGSAFADDPPDRVARLSYLRGEVSFQPSGVEEWSQATLNRPLYTGDRIYTDRDSRTELEIGAATLRLDERSSFDLLNLDDNLAQVELTEGVMNIHVRRVFEGQTYEVDTPTLAFVINQPGDYRIDIAPDGSSSMITVFRGAGDVYGENNASYSVRSGQSYRFNDSTLRDYEVLDLPRPDDFDGWVDSRNNRYENSPSRQYVSEDVIGYADLDEYGGWSDVPDYGHVWYPTNVAVGWAPYRSGHWSWIDPWGWTWVDTAAWGFAPFHYGRWAYVGNRWGWCPGPVNVRPIYAPALVAFVGGNGWGVGVNVGGPVGWFPLGPRDVYVPWYGASRSYFTNVNVRNTTVINNTYITNVYNNYSAGRPINNANYAYRQNTAAVTAVSRQAFVGARNVNTARVQVNEGQLRNANVVSRVGIAPERASFVSANAQRAQAPSAQTLDRRVIARTQPPARAVPVAQRIDAIKRNGDQPLTTPQLRQTTSRGNASPTADRNSPQRVQVVGSGSTKPEPLPARAPANTASRNGPNDRANPANDRANPANTRTAPNAPANAQTNRTSPNAPANTPNTRNAPQGTPQRGSTSTTQDAPNSRAMPSSRYAPRSGETTPANRTNAPNSTTNARQPPASSNERNAPSSRNQPASTRDTTPSTQRSAPSNASPNRTAPQNAPAERRSTTTPPAQRNEPAQRSSSQSYERPAPQQQQQRSTPPPQQQRSSPPPQQQRSSPPPQQQRSSPPPQQQRSAPPPQQQRSTPPPQQRSAPPPQQQRSAPPPPQQRSAPPPRTPPPSKEKDDKDKDREGGRSR